ncbi:MAG: hypothetical protein ACLT2Z_03010 [Eubacterium sp.]
MGKKDKYENSGQITLEASIVVPDNNDSCFLFIWLFTYMML